MGLGLFCKDFLTGRKRDLELLVIYFGMPPWEGPRALHLRVVSKFKKFEPGLVNLEGEALYFCF